MDLTSAISQATDYIAGEEQFSPTPYPDVNGYAIGFGNHYYMDGSSVDASDDPISYDDAYALLQFYVAQNMNAIAAQITVPLTNNQLVALTSIRYNCGTITTALANLINSGADPGTVAAQIQNTCATSGGQPSAVISNRRLAEGDLYTTPDNSLFSGGSSGVLVAIGAVVAVYFLVEG